MIYDKAWCAMWRITDSNRWPPACKAGALASWANPPFALSVVLSRLELLTPTLSVWCSNQLSYRTVYIEQNCRQEEVNLKYKSLLIESSVLSFLTVAFPCFFRKEVFILTCLTFACASVELRQETSSCILQKGGVLGKPWTLLSSVSSERRCSSRTFRYGYLVTT